MNAIDWIQLGSLPPEELADARLQLHWATQIVASVGFSFVDPEADWAHLSLNWTPQNRIQGQWTTGPNRFRAALDPSRLVLSLTDTSGAPLGGFQLLGHTLEDAYEWLEASVDDILGSANTGLLRPDHSLPRHGVDSGAPFRPSRSHLLEICSWYRNASLVLSEVAGREDDSSAVRLWPHHFDMAFLLQIDEDQGSETARSVGVGLSPGDAEADSPYWYVSPWPYPPDNAALPETSYGEWTTDDWTGIVLSAEETVAAETPDDQRSLVESFLTDGISVCRQVLT